MQKINDKAARIFDILTKGMTKIGDHKKIENGAYMPLCVEVIDRQGLMGGLRISLCHYGEQNGDLMRDPEICFIRVPGIEGKGIWAPYYYRNDYLGIEQFACEFDENGAVASFKPKMQRDIAIFSGQWAQNLKNQGFLDAKPLHQKLPPMAISEPVKEALKPSMRWGLTQDGVIIDSLTFKEDTTPQDVLAEFEAIHGREKVSMVGMRICIMEA